MRLAQRPEQSFPLGVRVTVTNRGQLVVPAVLRVRFSDGSKIDVAVPAETWMQNDSHIFTLETDKTAVDATIDPDRRLPDRDRSNNTAKLTPSSAF